MDYGQNPSQAELTRVLVAADTGIDPHRLVRLCCERADSDTLSVSLLVPMEDKPQPGSEGGDTDARLLSKAATLFDAAGVRLEDFIVAEDDSDTLDELVRSGDFDSVVVCTANDDHVPPVLQLTAQLARTHGLAVVESGHGRSGNPNWLKRLIGAVTSRHLI
jgi:nucleotide-binding universal stress UspA family protein